MTAAGHARTLGSGSSRTRSSTSAALQPGGTDLPQLLLIDTVSGYGNDWYVIGVDLPTGRLVTTASLVVTDTFGAEPCCGPNGHQATASSSGWSMFQHAMPVDEGEADGVADDQRCSSSRRRAGPAARWTRRSRRCCFLRDEQANVGWAVERRLTSPLEQAVDAAERRARPGHDAPPGRPRDVAPDYRLATRRPAALDPAAAGARRTRQPEIRLARGSVLDVDGGRRVVEQRHRPARRPRRSRC